MIQWLSDAWDLFWISDAPFLIAIFLFAISLAIMSFRSQS